MFLAPSVAVSFFNLIASLEWRWFDAKLQREVGVAAPASVNNILKLFNQSDET